MVFGSWCLKVTFWSLETMFFGFAMIELTFAVKDNPKFIKILRVIKKSKNMTVKPLIEEIQLKSYNLWGNCLGVQGPRAIYPVKTKILEFCELI